jgi:hypothetical protein
MISAEDAFVTDFQSLMKIAGDDTLIHNPSPRSIEKALQAVVILRRWLLDADPLIHQVNRQIKLKLVFRINSLDDYEDIEYISREMAPKRVVSTFLYHNVLGLEDHELPSGVKSVSLSQFLKTPIHWYQGRMVATVMDVILYYAHVAGAVHRGQPKTNSAREPSKLWSLNTRIQPHEQRPASDIVFKP